MANFGNGVSGAVAYLRFFDIRMDSIKPSCNTNEQQSGLNLASVSESVTIEEIAQFLPAHDHDELYRAACTHRELFLPPGGVGSAVGGSLYWSLETVGESSEGNQLGEAVDALGKRILDRLPSLFTALGVEPFPVSRIPISLIHGLDGHSGIPHSDSSGGRFKISLLYYFHRTPKAFRGGDLEIYGTVPGSETGHSDEPLMKIEFEDNLLLAFPSETFHGVTEVSCDSSEFADGRFVAVAFLGNS